ncbi:MAG: hypothetical protein U0640_00020 [Phycisphaerales bacterium]
MPAGIWLRRTPDVGWSGLKGLLEALVSYMAKQASESKEVPENFAFTFSKEHLANSNILHIHFLDICHFALADLVFLKSMLQKMKQEFPHSASFWNLEYADAFHLSIDELMIQVDKAIHCARQESPS